MASGGIGPDGRPTRAGSAQEYQLYVWIWTDMLNNFRPNYGYKSDGYQSGSTNLGDDPISAVRTLKNQMRQKMANYQSMNLPVKVKIACTYSWIEHHSIFRPIFAKLRAIHWAEPKVSSSVWTIKEEMHWWLGTAELRIKWRTKWNRLDRVENISRLLSIGKRWCDSECLCWSSYWFKSGNRIPKIDQKVLDECLWSRLKMDSPGRKLSSKEPHPKATASSSQWSVG